MHSSSPARMPKSQLSTGECWNPSRKRDPTSKDRAEATTRWQEGQDHIKIKSQTRWVGDPQMGEQEKQRSSYTVANILGPTWDFPTWGFSKGTGNPKGIWLWRTAGFDYRTSTGLGETDSWKAQTKPLSVHLYCKKWELRGEVKSPFDKEIVVPTLSRQWKDNFKHNSEITRACDQHRSHEQWPRVGEENMVSSTYGGFPEDDLAKNLPANA